MTHSILDYGAEAGANCTVALQRAIDSCHDAGGGRVLVPAGKFITGTVQLRSFVELHLEAGAILQGSTERSDYRETFRRHGMIFAEDAEHVSLTGLGVLDARGTAFYDQSRNHDNIDFDPSLTQQGHNYGNPGRFQTDGPIGRGEPQGMSVCFYHCSHVTLRDLTIKDTPTWAVRFATCEDVLADGVTIRNNLMVPNSDGLHCTVCRNVRIVNCDIQAGDDAIIVTGFPVCERDEQGVLYNARPHPFGNKSGWAENHVISGCHLQSRSSGIRVGYGSHSIRRCVFNNLQVYGSNRGIGLYAHNDAAIEELVFTNIHLETRLHDGLWWGHGEPIVLSAVPHFENEPAGRLRHITFQNIHAVGGQGIVLFGLPESRIENIRFQNLRLRVERGPHTDSYGGNFDLRPAANPRHQIFAHPVPGIFAQCVDGLRLLDVDLTWGENLPAYFTAGLQCEDVTGLFQERCFLPDNPTQA